MRIGYIRVSRDEQLTALQDDAMAKAQCGRIFTDKISGKNVDRPALKRMLEFAREGDIIVIWRLDRLGRSLLDLIDLVKKLDAQGIQIISLRENIDTTTSIGKFLFHIMASLAEFERDLLRERTIAGLEAARARGRIGGRPPISLPPQTLARARELYEGKELSVREICRMTGMRRSSFYTYVVHNGEQKRKKK